MSDPVAIPACPRCGYDFRGSVAAWDTRGVCDVEGTCSECGLTFSWREVLNPSHTVPHWSFEHARQHRAWAFMLSFVAACNPAYFWRRIRMEHVVRTDRLIALVIVTATLFHAGMSLLSAAVARQLAVRAVAMSTWTKPPPGATGTVPDPDSVALLTLAFPYANWLQLPSWVYRLIEPRPLINLATWSSLLVALLMAASFGLLPETLQKARVRRVHIARAFCWSLCGVSGLLLVVNFVTAAAIVDDNTRISWQVCSWIEAFSPLVQVAGSLIFVAIWWWVAIRRYLRLNHAVGVWIAMLTVASLATAVIATGIALIDYQFRY